MRAESKWTKHDPTSTLLGPAWCLRDEHNTVRAWSGLGPGWVRAEPGPSAHILILSERILSRIARKPECLAIRVVPWVWESSASRG